jgi:putative acetyltransferase
MQIRLETARDVESIRALNLAAFESRTEAHLVDALRLQALPLLSLVADADGVVVGHILFSPATLDSDPDIKVMGLAPMAVAPGWQRQGIGSALVTEGITRCRALSIDAIIVIGHAHFYPRFGFAPASRFGITCEYDVPDDVFMMLVLDRNRLSGKSGLVRYHPVFNTV